MAPTLEMLLNPGRVVVFKSLSEEDRAKLGFTVKVFRIGLKHFERHGRVLAGAVQMLATTSVNMKDSKSPGLQYLSFMIPYTMCNLLPLLAETVRIEPKEAMTWDEVPHFLIPDILEAWIDENFGTKEKWVPWVAVAEKMLNGLTDKTFAISETISKILSKQVTPSETSSIAQQEPTRTPAGV